MVLERIARGLALLTIFAIGWDRSVEGQEVGFRAWASNVIVPQARSYAIGRQPTVLLEQVRAGVVIRGQAATTRLEVVLRNPSAGRLEAELLLTLCTSPALADGRLYLRQSEAVVAYDLRAAP